MWNSPICTYCKQFDLGIMDISLWFILFKCRVKQIGAESYPQDQQDNHHSQCQFDAPVQFFLFENFIRQH